MKGETTTRLADRITKGNFVFDGEAVVECNDNGVSEFVASPNPNMIQSSSSELQDRAIANAELIAEAFNTTNECGYTPKELLEQRNELLAALIDANDWLKRSGDSRFYPNYLIQVIKKYQP